MRREYASCDQTGTGCAYSSFVSLLFGLSIGLFPKFKALLQVGKA
jgi:hypothetical protein